MQTIIVETVFYKEYNEKSKVIALSNILIWLVFLIFTGSVIPMLEAVLDVVPIDKLAVHFHDTYGQALSNILISLQVNTLYCSYADILLGQPFYIRYFWNLCQM